MALGGIGVILALMFTRPTPPGGSVGGLRTATPASSSAISKAGLKPAIHGLLYLRGTPPSPLRSELAGYVVEGPGDYGAVSWSQLQASPEGPITPDNPIDRAITEMHTWNAANTAHPEVLKVRINAGIHSPAWAMTLGGACVSVRDPGFGVQGCTPRFWTPQFAAAFYDFERELAAKYDTVPEIAEVVIARNMTIYNEPLLRQTSDPGSVADLISAGYTTANDEINQLTDIAGFGRYWKHTRVGFAFNPYQTISPTGVDEGFTERLMTYGRQMLGSQLVLENDSLRSSFLSATALYAQMYAAMTRAGGPIGFQTAVLRKVGSLTSTLDTARRLGASHVELPPGFEAQLTLRQVGVYGGALMR